MEEFKAIIRTYVSKGMKVETAAQMAGMSKSSYYYKPRPGLRGRKPDTHTKLGEDLVVPNDQVIKQIRSVLSLEFMENGYRKVMHELQDMNYRIGKTKTFRLMKENRLLLSPKRKGARQYVRFTQPLPLEPFEKLEMDIKFIYIRGERKNALLLTIIDTFTRLVLAWDLQYSIRHTQVGSIFNQAICQWLQPNRPPYSEEISVTLRCDNDSRFVAHDLQCFLAANFINQEFILPATPQQNAHIESFHSVVEELVCKKYEFDHIHHARWVLQRFYHVYNERRTISSLMYLPPKVFLEECQKGNIGVNMRKNRGRVIQKFFFRGQRPKWHSAPTEDFFCCVSYKDITESNNFVKPSLNES